MSSVRPPSATAVPAMLWPPPRTDSARPCSRAKPTAATTSAVPLAWTTSAGVVSIMPFHSRVASVEARLPGQEHRAADVDDRLGGHAASVPIAVRSAATNASGCSIGGSSAQSSITCSGHPWSRLAATATSSRVARS